MRALATAAVLVLAVGCGPSDQTSDWSTTEARLPVDVRGATEAWAIPKDGLQCEIHTNPDLGYTVQVGAIGPDDVLEFVGPGYGLAKVRITDGNAERSVPFFDNGTDGAVAGSLSRFPVAPGTGTRGWWYLSDPSSESAGIVSLDDRPTACSVVLEVYPTDDAVAWRGGS